MRKSTALHFIRFEGGTTKWNTEVRKETKRSCASVEKYNVHFCRSRQGRSVKFLFPIGFTFKREAHANNFIAQSIFPQRNSFEHIFHEYSINAGNQAYIAAF